MKKHKRDKTDTIVSRGYQAGISGKSINKCPYTDTTLKHLWLSGWREGREDNWSGLKGVSSIHRLNV
ncbi:MAG TPA: ribosome modulation factor [Pseudomonadales bacterium]